MISHNLAAKGRGEGGGSVGSMKTCVEDSAKSTLHPPYLGHSSGKMQDRVHTSYFPR